MMTDDDRNDLSDDRGRGRPDEELARQLVERPGAEGVDLVGPDGLLAGVTKRVLETGLQVELSEHLGYDKHAAEGRNGGNSRNGTRSKTVLIEIGPVELNVPGGLSMKLLGLEFGEDVVAVVIHTNGSQRSFQASTNRRIAATRSSTDAKLPRWIAWRVMIAKNVSRRCASPPSPHPPGSSWSNVKRPQHRFLSYAV